MANNIFNVLDESQPKNRNIYFSESLRPLTKWMSVIGFSIPTNRFNLISRSFIFLWVFSVQLAINCHIYVNLESVVTSYTPNASSSALKWNYVIDALNFAICLVANHILFLKITQPSAWNNLMDSFEQSINWQLNYKCRRASWLLILSTIVSVIWF